MRGRLADPAGSRIVIVGTPAYRDPQLPDVPAVANNIADLAAVLTDPRVGRFESAYCVTAPTVASIAEVGALIVEAAEQAEDLLLFYYSGHGLLGSRSHELYLSLAGTQKENVAFTAVPFAAVRDACLDSRAKSRVVILDSCYSGRAIGETLGDTSEEVLGQVEVAGTFTLTSAPANRTALILPGEHHTAFTERLLSLLRDGSPQAGEFLTLGDIYRHLHTRMRAEGLPLPQQRGTETADLLGLVRNRYPATRAHQNPAAAIPQPFKRDPQDGAGSPPTAYPPRPEPGYQLRWQPDRSPHPDGLASDDQGDNKPPVFGTAFDLSGQIASEIGPDAAKGRLRRALRKTAPPIIAVRPRTYNEARTVGEHFREGNPVIMKLNGMDDSDGKRLIDFSAGLIFGLRGTIERLTNRVYLLTPINIDIAAEDKGSIASGISPDKITTRWISPSSAKARLNPTAGETAPQITTLRLRTYNEARTVGELFREGNPVIMNLNGMDDSDSKRLVDFSAGLIFGLRGTIERLTNKVFLLTPINVQITVEDKALIANHEFFKQS